MSPYDSGSYAPYLNQLRQRVTERVTPIGRRFGRPGLIAAGLAVAIVVSSMIFVLTRGPGGRAPAPAPAMTVSETHLTERRIVSSVSGIGSVAAWEELSIAAEAPGLRVDKVLVEEGDVVKAGQVLAVLDAAILQAQLRQSEARVVEAKSTLAVAENNHQRATELVKQGFISASTLDDRASGAQTAAARLTAAIAARDELAARVAQAKILAPTDGRIAKRSILTGDVVTPGKEAFRLIRDDRLELDAQIPESDMTRVATGQGAVVTHDGITPVTGTVRLVSPTVDPKTRLGTVHISLPPDSGLRAGMYARAEIALADQMAKVVPDEAVIWRGTQPPLVYVITDDDHVMVREITAGTRKDGWVEIKEGLAMTDRIAAAGAGFLNDGDRVKVVKTSAGADVKHE